MAFFLRKTVKQKGLYLQICETVYNKETKLSSNRNVKVLGYADSYLDQFPDPVKHFEDLVLEMNNKAKEEKSLKVSETNPVTKNIGYFLLKAMLNTLDVKRDLDLMGNGFRFEKSVSEFIETMIYCQIVKPSSKLRNAQDIIPFLYGTSSFSEDQIYRMINFIGSNYKKYIEIFNHHVLDVFGRNYNHVFFDCTNYYFEIDLPKDDKQKGPSKENRKDPIIGQALLLDGNQIPLCMEMYPGNQSEKPYIRKLIDEMKIKSNVKGRTIQVADKGLNCARNIFSATKEANDGYVFSKSVHGNYLSSIEKEWILLEDDLYNKWTEIKDAKGRLLYKVKEVIDVFDYEFTNDDGEKVKFKQKEKRVVSYNPCLAKKQIAEIEKQVEKVMKLNTIKGLKRTEYGDAVKYAKFNGEVEASLNLEKIEEDKRYAGYNLIVTSETKLSALEIYDIYHGLWRIEESFRITKSQLEARPVYLQTKESIYGHFLICYLSLLLLRLLEFKIFDHKINTSDLISYIRDFKITSIGDRYVSNILMSETLKKVKEVTQLNCIDNYYLDKKTIQNLLDFEFFVH